ncbi:MAG: GHKL domain-containing protein [Lachnospiraceae bacterium]|nr:GHKL domain-containing protein [Lachnospiraceae bacterium]
MMQKILNYGIYLLFIYIIIEYFDTFLKRKRQRGTYFALIWMAYFVIQIAMPVLIENSAVAILINVIVLFAICRAIYQGATGTCFLLSFALVAMWMVVELLTGYGLIAIDMNIPGIQKLGSVISKLILFAILIVIQSKMEICSLHDINLRYVGTLLVLPICSIFVIYNLYLLDYNKEKGFHYISTVSIVLILLLNLMFYVIYEKLSKEAEIEKQNCIFEKQLELCMDQMQEREQMNLEIMELKHNIKGHLICINEYIKKGDTEIVQEYLSDVYSSFENEHKICETSNLVIDSIINYKYRECLEKDITFKCEICIPANTVFDNVDLSMILGNALDNAIDATVKLEIGKRYIAVRITFHHYNLLIEICNSFNGIVKKDSSGKYLTIKKDRKNHGLGLGSIEKAAAKYCGLVSTELSDDEFKLLVLLYGM